MNAPAFMPTVEHYDAAFALEKTIDYPAITAFEQRMGYALDRAKLESAARVLACPIKQSPPNWQHGRVLYAAMRSFLDNSFVEAIKPNDSGEGWVWPGLNVLDIGSAKGFSALCLQWALADSGAVGLVTSIDVLDPNDKVSRNTVAEVGGLKTLAEILEPWPESQAITFVQDTSRDWLTEHTGRIHFAYVDGKHSYEAVGWDAALLAQRQQSGDVIVFDDVQISGVNQAVTELRGYDVERLFALATRGYAIARKR